MTETEIKVKQQDEWLKQHTLSPEQFKQLILNKMNRAATLQQALIKREMLTKHR
jgi:uncharacterized protein YjaZ